MTETIAPGGHLMIPILKFAIVKKTIAMMRDMQKLKPGTRQASKMLYKRLQAGKFCFAESSFLVKRTCQREIKKTSSKKIPCKSGILNGRK